MNAEGYLDGCDGCEISQGRGGVNERGGVIPLPGGWIVNHYDVDEGFLGYLALQTCKHRADFAELLTNEAVALGGNIKDIHMVLHDYWSQNFPGDPLERVYVVYFSEALPPHLHFHIIPRTKRIKEMELKTKILSQEEEIEGGSFKCEGWKIYLVPKCKDIPPEYVTKKGKNKRKLLKLMEYIKSKLSVG